MIETIATISVLDEAITALDDGRPRYEIKDSLKSYRDKLQEEVDSFDKWATNQSDIDTSIQLEIDSTTESQ